jgi:hypothetical protein
MDDKQVIIGLSGRKQSGKNTAMNFIVGLHLKALSIVKGKFDLTEKGELYVQDIFGNTDDEGIFDINMGTPQMEAFLTVNVDPYIKVYSFADLLKQEVCMKILGLTYEQCYGTDQEKNSLTHLKWEDMPGVITEVYVLNTDAVVTGNYVNGDLLTFPECNYEHYFHSAGQMTAREVMQFVGTNIFRKMCGNVWVDALLRRVIQEGSATAIIYDCRFPNEVFGIQDKNGKVIRLARNPHPEDKHDSETALDPENFDWNKFDAIVKNENSSIHEQNVELYNILKGWNLLPVELEGF